MAKRVAILGEVASWHVKELERAFGVRGWETAVVDAGDFRAAEGLLHRAPRPEVLWVRHLSSGNTEQTIFRMDLLYHCAFQGMWVINPPEALERAVDKYFTQMLLERADLPVVPTVVSESRERILERLDAWGTVVVKPLFGSQGKGLFLLEDKDVAWRVLTMLGKVGTVFLAQPYIPYRRDVRAFVVNDRVLAQMERKSGDWRANVARGAVPAAAALPARARRLAVEAAHVLHCWYAGVDLLETAEGEWRILEVNGIAGWQGLQRVTPFNLADRLAEEVDHALGGHRDHKLAGGSER
ncbi:MAG: RimK family alpha-L-glutamate ligase [Firmicutes bacterium]|nr:RimK family alpha-L-glutamate ligase [Bacillota bacterium]